jgi:hypothetical protein
MFPTDLFVVRLCGFIDWRIFSRSSYVMSTTAALAPDVRTGAGCAKMAGNRGLPCRRMRVDRGILGA